MSATTIVERALESVTVLRMKLLFVDAIVMNPQDWQRIKNNEWIVRGKNDIEQRLWGLPVILTDRAEEGKPMAATWGRL